MQPESQVTAAARTAPAPVLVLGLGNILLRDEGVGVRVVEALRGRALPAGIDLADGGTAGLDLLDLVADRQKVVVIDAIAGPQPPGTVLRLTPDQLAAPAGRPASVHEAGLLEALAAARHLGCAPREVVILGVRPQEVSCGLELSPALARLLPRIAELVLAELAGAAGPPGARRPEGCR